MIQGQFETLLSKKVGIAPFNALTFNKTPDKSLLESGNDAFLGNDLFVFCFFLSVCWN